MEQLNRRLENGAPQPVRVWLIEPDPFARWSMAHYLRTCPDINLLASTSAPGNIVRRLNMLNPQIILLDSEHMLIQQWLTNFEEIIPLQAPTARVICIGIRANHWVMARLNRPVFWGYVLKGEMQEHLSTAVLTAAEGFWAMTPGIERSAKVLGIHYPEMALIGPDFSMGSASPIL